MSKIWTNPDLKKAMASIPEEEFIQEQEIGDAKAGQWWILAALTVVAIALIIILTSI